MARRITKAGTPGVVGSMRAPGNIPPPPNMKVTGGGGGPDWVGMPVQYRTAGPLRPNPPWPVDGGGIAQGRRSAGPQRYLPPGIAFRNAAGDPWNITKEDWGRTGQSAGPFNTGGPYGWRGTPPADYKGPGLTAQGRRTAGPFNTVGPYGWRGTPPVGGGGRAQGGRTAGPFNTGGPYGWRGTPPADYKGPGLTAQGRRTAGPFNTVGPYGWRGTPPVGGGGRVGENRGISQSALKNKYGTGFGG